MRIPRDRFQSGKVNGRRSRAIWLTLLVLLPPVSPASAEEGYELIRLGFVDAAHTSNNFKWSEVGAINAGYIAGTSRRYLGGSGQSAWVASIAEGVTIRLGYTDTQHTSSSGVQSSSIVGSLRTATS